MFLKKNTLKTRMIFKYTIFKHNALNTRLVVVESSNLESRSPVSSPSPESQVTYKIQNETRKPETYVNVQS